MSVDGNISLAVMAETATKRSVWYVIIKAEVFVASNGTRSLMDIGIHISWMGDVIQSPLFQFNCKIVGFDLCNRMKDKETFGDNTFNKNTLKLKLSSIWDYENHI